MLPILPILRRIISLCCLSILFISVFIFTVGTSTLTTHAHNSTNSKQPLALADFPTVDPNYIYDQLYYMATSFQHREAGYDTNLPPMLNGHNEFANYWAQEISRDLVGFGPQVYRDPFHVAGWQGRVATVPAVNVEVTVPGVSHPEQVVVIGCHYDGEAISTQSANDDASGCAIELGIAKAMGEYWRSHNSYPARTLRFVLFDAEEQGLYGSFHYVNSTVNGDLQNITAMFNEEQNGIAYPLRFLGKMSNPVLPLYINLTPIQNNQWYPHQNALSQVQIDSINRFRSLMQQAVPAVFQQFQAMGYQTLLYHSNNSPDVSQPIFTADQQQNIQLQDDTLGSSDQVPFTLAGIPCATLVGNSTYYDANPPPWSYPYDQKTDTIQLMNTFANGGTQKATALTLSLALPAMLTTWMLNQPAILGSTTANTGPIAAVSDVGQTLVGQSLTLNALASYVPGSTTQPLSYVWNLGDGTTASSVSVNHTYQFPGTYSLTLTVTSSTSKLLISKEITVVSQTVQYPDPYSGFQSNGVPPTNSAVVLPTPTTPTPATVPTATATATTHPPNTTAGNPFSIVGFLLLLVVSLVIIILVVRGTRLKRKKEDL